MVNGRSVNLRSPFVRFRRDVYGVQPLSSATIRSHDQRSRDRMSTHILAFESDSEVVWFEGNFGAYIEDLKRRKGPDADQPHRIKYKKLVR